MTEHVPDYANFPAVPQAPDTRRRFAYYLQVAHLPFVSGGNANALIVIGGVILPGVGFVPLGLDGQQDMGGSGIVRLHLEDRTAARWARGRRLAVLATGGAPQRRCAPGPGLGASLRRLEPPGFVDLRTGGSTHR